jgi:hypothetical protein
MPLIYGEGMKSFERLQLALMSVSGDQSLFAWGLPYKRGGISAMDPGRNTKQAEPLPGSILASSPNQFANSRYIVPTINPSAPLSPFFVTNQGLQFEMPILVQPWER